MSTQRPSVVLVALANRSQRKKLADALAVERVAPHDNTLDFLIEVVNAGAMTAQYLLTSAARGGTDVAIRMGHFMDGLWELGPSANARSETLRWLDHSLVTLAAFSPRAEQLDPHLVMRPGNQ